jgi:hypothetical protein
MFSRNSIFGQGVQHAYLQDENRFLPDKLRGFRTWNSDQFLHPPNTLMMTTSWTRLPVFQKTQNSLSELNFVTSRAPTIIPTLSVPSQRYGKSLPDGTPLQPDLKDPGIIPTFMDSLRPAAYGSTVPLNPALVPQQLQTPSTPYQPPSFPTVTKLPLNVLQDQLKQFAKHSKLMDDLRDSLQQKKPIDLKKFKDLESFQQKLLEVTKTSIPKGLGFTDEKELKDRLKNLASGAARYAKDSEALEAYLQEAKKALQEDSVKFLNTVLTKPSSVNVARKLRNVEDADLTLQTIDSDLTSLTAQFNEFKARIEDRIKNSDAYKGEGDPTKQATMIVDGLAEAEKKDAGFEELQTRIADQQRLYKDITQFRDILSKNEFESLTPATDLEKYFEKLVENGKISKDYEAALNEVSKIQKEISKLTPLEKNYLDLLVARGDRKVYDYLKDKYKIDLAALPKKRIIKITDSATQRAIDKFKVPSYANTEDADQYYSFNTPSFQEQYDELRDNLSSIDSDGGLTSEQKRAGKREVYAAMLELAQKDFEYTGTEASYEQMQKIKQELLNSFTEDDFKNDAEWSWNKPSDAKSSLYRKAIILSDQFDELKSMQAIFARDAVAATLQYETDVRNVIPTVLPKNVVVAPATPGSITPPPARTILTAKRRNRGTGSVLPKSSGAPPKTKSLRVISPEKVREVDVHVDSYMDVTGVTGTPYAEMKLIDYDDKQLYIASYSKIHELFTGDKAPKEFIDTLTVSRDSFIGDKSPRPFCDHPYVDLAYRMLACSTTTKPTEINQLCTKYHVPYHLLQVASNNGAIVALKQYVENTTSINSVHLIRILEKYGLLAEDSHQSVIDGYWKDADMQVATWDDFMLAWVRARENAYKDARGEIAKLEATFEVDLDASDPIASCSYIDTALSQNALSLDTKAKQDSVIGKQFGNIKYRNRVIDWSLTWSVFGTVLESLDTALKPLTLFSV